MNTSGHPPVGGPEPLFRRKWRAQSTLFWVSAPSETKTLFLFRLLARQQTKKRAVQSTALFLVCLLKLSSVQHIYLTLIFGSQRHYIIAVRFIQRIIPIAPRIIDHCRLPFCRVGLSSRPGIGKFNC